MRPHEREVLVQRVRNTWISGVLDPSLEGTVPLTLDLERRMDVLDLTGRPTRLDGRPLAPIVPGSSLLRLFDNVGKSLLVLGAPGAGKTTALLALARDLLERAEGNSAEPVPIVVKLSSWSHHARRLEDWLVGELNTGYGISPRTARALIATGGMVLLLDELDQVAQVDRAGCVQAINDHMSEHDLSELVVTCRTEQLEGLGPRLHLEEAPELRPLDDGQVIECLTGLERMGARVATLRRAIGRDAELRAVLRSPLVLRVIARASHGHSLAVLEEPGPAKQHRARLWDAYVASMFAQRPLDANRTEAVERAISQLAWLARALQHRDSQLARVLRGRSRQNELFYLDRLDPSWLPLHGAHRRTQWVIAVATAALLILLLFGVIRPLAQISPIVLYTVGPVIVLAAGLPAAPRIRTVAGIVAGASIGTYEGLTFDSISIGIGIAAAIFLVIVGMGRGVTSAETLRWSWSKLRRDLPATLAGLGIGLGTGLGLARKNGLIAGAIVGILIWLGLGLLFGLASELREERTTPMEGIRRSALHGLMVGTVALLIVALPVGITQAVRYGHHYHYGALTTLLYATTDGLANGTDIGLLFGLAYGGAAWLQHYTIRASLVLARVAPWRYESLLEEMKKRELLRRAGGAYLFIHPLLRDHLAGLDQAGIRRIVADYQSMCRPR